MIPVSGILTPMMPQPPPDLTGKTSWISTRIQGIVQSTGISSGWKLKHLFRDDKDVYIILINFKYTYIYIILLYIIIYIFVVYTIVDHKHI